ncbi:MAG TPA: lysylphosphatidylglycerol synthase transmembrane domain-containing protein [Miltoncostaeaceae bacterium]|nr:lysylphosphatidylglycerol synthase transmembrane domain-containing protein [Miltoncostaeaceae bacterium]
MPGSPDRRSRVPWAALGVLAAVAGAALAGFLVGATRAEAPRTRRVVRTAGDSWAALESAYEALRDRVLEVAPLPLGLALAVSLVNGAFVAAAWRRVIRAAYPESRLRWRTAFGAHYAGVGVNALLPARAGDVVRLFVMHRRVEGASYPTLGATMAVEAVFNAAVGLALLLWAWQAGYLPAAPTIPTLPLFELSLYAAHPWILAVIAAVLLLALFVAAERIRAFWRRVGQGLVVLTQPRAYLLGVLPLQAAGFACRTGSAYLFLMAFGVEASLRNALLVQVAGGLASLVPATPGGLGPRQALLVVLLAGEGSRGDVLAFGLGMELALTAMHALVGIACLWALTGRRGLRGAVRSARRDRAQATGPVAEPPGGAEGP